jgi:hypothetical protein
MLVSCHCFEVRREDGQRGGGAGNLEYAVGVVDAS